jgi:hypothetical protein
MTPAETMAAAAIADSSVNLVIETPSIAAATPSALGRRSSAQHIHHDSRFRGVHDVDQLPLERGDLGL